MYRMERDKGVYLDSIGSMLRIHTSSIARAPLLSDNEPIIQHRDRRNLHFTLERLRMQLDSPLRSTVAVAVDPVDPEKKTVLFAEESGVGPYRSSDCMRWIRGFCTHQITFDEPIEPAQRGYDGYVATIPRAMSVLFERSYSPPNCGPR